jgi:hypothetical protein
VETQLSQKVPLNHSKTLLSAHQYWSVFLGLPPRDEVLPVRFGAACFVYNKNTEKVLAKNSG